mmetsp:Transcript_20823/g.41531  ORF Transcript_20823/g.41531 Transcript_20823/m.41531 type:complete len:397 (-) Transcript_20823:970-2160(-)
MQSIIYPSILSPSVDSFVYLIYLHSSALGLSVLLEHADAVGRHLQDLIGIDILHGAVEGELEGRCDSLVGLLRCRAHVRQSLLLADVHPQIVVSAVDSDDHASVDFVTRGNKNIATLLRVLDSLSRARAVCGCDQTSSLSRLDHPCGGSVRVESRVDHGESLGGREKLRSQSDGCSCGDQVEQCRLSVQCLHVGHLGLSCREDLNHSSHVLLRDSHFQSLPGFTLDPVNLLLNHTGGSNHQFVSLSSHVLHKDRQVHLASPRDDVTLSLTVEVNLQGNISVELLLESISQLVDGQELGVGVLPEKRGGVHLERHTDRGILDLDGLERSGVVEVNDGVSNGELLQAREAHDVSRNSLVDWLLSKIVEHKQLSDRVSSGFLSWSHDSDLHSLLESSCP